MFGQEIKESRILKGATQTQVAKATGLPQATISWIELDKGIPNILQCVKLADFYEIYLDELIGRDKDYRKNNSDFKVQKTQVIERPPYDLSDKSLNDFMKLFKMMNELQKAQVSGYVIGMLEQSGINVSAVLK